MAGPFDVVLIGARPPSPPRESIRLLRHAADLLTTSGWLALTSRTLRWPGLLGRAGWEVDECVDIVEPRTVAQAEAALARCSPGTVQPMDPGFDTAREVVFLCRKA